MQKNGANIVLGVSGSIAAYKACSVLRGIISRGCEVKVVMTDSAQHLVGAPTFRSLSGRPVCKDLWEVERGGDLVHIDLAEWSNLLAVVPATANIMGKFANGIADDLLSTLWMAADCPKVIAPAMNDRMWASSAVQRNVETLKNEDVIRFVGPVEGKLASGKEGEAGRLAPVEEIITAICNCLLEFCKIQNLTAIQSYEKQEVVKKQRGKEI